MEVRDTLIQSFLYYSYSDVGKKRKDNQDNYFVLDRGNWLAAVVCDGMGGMRGGHIASEIAIDVIEKELSTCTNSPNKEQLVAFMQKANDAVYQFGSRYPDYKGLGTTMSMLIFNSEGYLIGHVGDSRIYKLRNGDIELLTTDHTWAKELELSGVYRSEVGSNSPMSHMLTRSLGVKNVMDVDIIASDDLEKHDVYLLCSDGIYNYCDANTISRSFDRSLTDLKAFSHLLSDISMEKGAEDNLTVIACELCVDKKQLSNIPPSNHSLKGRALSVSSAEMDQMHDVPAHVEQRNDLPEENRYHYFLYGSLFALLAGFYVNSIRPIREHYVQDTAPIIRVDESKKNQEVVPLVPFKKDIVVRGGHTITLESLYRHIRDKKQEILYPVLSFEKEPLLSQTTVRTEINPTRPIVWENEASRVEQIKKVYKDDLLYSDFKNDIKVKKDKQIYDEKDKALIREKIFDVHEKIKQLGISSAQEKDAAVVNYKEMLSDIASDMQTLALLEHELKSNEQTYLELKKLFTQNSSSSLYLLANRVASFDPSIAVLTQRVRMLEDTRDYYSNLMNKVPGSDELITKLSGAQREYAQVFVELRQEVGKVLQLMLREIAAFYAGVEYVQYLLSLEQSRVQRHLGYVQILTSDDASKKRSLADAYFSELQTLVLQYRSMDAAFSVSEESRQGLIERFEKNKNNIEEK